MTLTEKLDLLLGERGLGGTDPDLEARARRWHGERGKRADACGARVGHGAAKAEFETKSDEFVGLLAATVEGMGDSAVSPDFA